MVKLVTPICDVCNKQMDAHYFIWKPGYQMDNKDVCIYCSEKTMRTQ
jgi:hypothetical protein